MCQEPCKEDDVSLARDTRKIGETKYWFPSLIAGSWKASVSPCKPPRVFGDHRT